MAAQIRVRDSGGTLRAVNNIYMRDQDNTVRTIKRIRMRDATNTLRTVFDETTPGGSDDVALSSYAVYAYKNRNGPVNVESETVFSTVNFGTGPYTYLWEYVSGSTSIFANDADESSTKFRCNNFTGVRQAVFRLKVTDSLAVTEYSANITIELEVITG